MTDQTILTEFLSIYHYYIITTYHIRMTIFIFHYYEQNLIVASIIIHCVNYRVQTIIKIFLRLLKVSIFQVFPLENFNHLGPIVHVSIRSNLKDIKILVNRSLTRNVGRHEKLQLGVARYGSFNSRKIQNTYFHIILDIEALAADPSVARSMSPRRFDFTTSLSHEIAFADTKGEPHPSGNILRISDT